MNCEVCGTVLRVSQFRFCSIPCYGAMWACAGEKIPFYEPPLQLEPDLEWELKQDLEWERMWELGWGLGRPTKHKNYGPEFNSDLKEQIREREGNRCFLCGSSQISVSLSVHHVDYNEANNDESNLAALCMNCHPKTNGNRDYWQKHITDLMEATYGYSYEREEDKECLDGLEMLTD